MGSDIASVVTLLDIPNISQDVHPIFLLHAFIFPPDFHCQWLTWLLLLRGHKLIRKAVIISYGNKLLFETSDFKRSDSKQNQCTNKFFEK